jgi:hypothetical protein
MTKLEPFSLFDKHHAEIPKPKTPYWKSTSFVMCLIVIVEIVAIVLATIAFVDSRSGNGGGLTEQQVIKLIEENSAAFLENGDAYLLAQGSAKSIVFAKHFPPP